MGFSQTAMPKPDKSCSSSCAGNKDEKCGGKQEMSVYKKEESNPPKDQPSQPEMPNHVGCMMNSHRHPALDNAFRKEDSDDMTVEECAKICFENMPMSVRAFGLSYGEMCSE